MDKQFQLTFNGQQVQKDDLELLGETAGLADDRLLASLIDMKFFGVTASKGIVMQGGASAIAPTPVRGGNADATVWIFPHRAVIGTRTASNVDMLDNVRDIRSCYSVAAGQTTYITPVSLAANASGLARVDLIYAAVAIDANGPTTTRKVKDPTTKVVTEESVALYKTTSITFSKVTGAPNAVPQPPVIPSDSGGTYYIPLAYVRVPNGFNATSVVSSDDILDIAPHVRGNQFMGGTTVEVASINSRLSATAFVTWANGGLHSYHYMSPTMRGSRGLLISVDTSSMGSGDVVDDASPDWYYNRACRFFCQVSLWSQIPPWTEDNGAPNANTLDTEEFFGFGQTFRNDSGNKRYVAKVTHSGGEFINIYLDTSDDKLHVEYGNITANRNAFFWIDFTGTSNLRPA